MLILVLSVLIHLKISILMEVEENGEREREKI